MNRTLTQLLPVLAIFGSIIGAAHYYFARRLVLDTAVPAPWSTAMLIGIAALGVSLIANPIIERTLTPPRSRALAWPSNVWMGACFYLLLGFWGADLITLLFGDGSVAWARTRATWVGGLTAGAVVLGMASVRLGPAVKRVELRIEGWPQALDGFGIVQLSDIHIGSLIRKRYAQRIVDRTNALQPDLIAVTGDLVDGSVHQLRDQVAPFADLRAREGVFFVTGNHDHYSGAARWVDCVVELGMIPLRNRSVPIGNAGAGFDLAGVDDVSSRRIDGRGYDMDAALADWDRRRPVVLLSHHPRTFDEAASKGVHLQLSGHTHGGQMWPFGWFVRLQTRYLAGAFRHGQSQLYVSRGTGYWGPPMRLPSRAEITHLVLYNCAKQSDRS